MTDDARNELEKQGQKTREKALEREARRAANQAEREARRAENQAKRQGGKGAKQASDDHDVAAPAKSVPAPKPDTKPDTKPAPKPAPAAPQAPAVKPAAKPAAVPASAEAAPAQPVATAAPKPAQAAPAPKPVAPKAAKAAQPASEPFNILLVGQRGKIGRQAVVFAASLRQNAPYWQGRLIVAEPRSEAAWAGERVELEDDVRKALIHFGAEIVPFTAHAFGKSYPYGNKIEALEVLPKDQPFIFFDSDTLITGPLDQIAFNFDRPSASMRRSGSWPLPPLYGPGFADIWKSLYDRFGLDFRSSLDTSQPDEHWERFLYFNAGWFFGRNPQEFRQRFLDWATGVRDEPGEALACQSLEPWLDQVVLPLVIHALGGGRPGAELAGLDGAITCHYRNLPLLYARETEAVMAAYEAAARDQVVQNVLKDDPEVQRMVFEGAGRANVRPLFAAEPATLPENTLRHRLRKEGFWFK